MTKHLCGYNQCFLDSALVNSEEDEPVNNATIKISDTSNIDSPSVKLLPTLGIFTSLL